MSWYRNETLTAWDPEITKAMTIAYEDAVARAQELGFANDDNALETIARYIVKGAERGKYDPKVLADGAIRYLQED
jgi:hypothetical protein